jgi:hypothetical protein
VGDEKTSGEDGIPTLCDLNKFDDEYPVTAEEKRTQRRIQARDQRAKNKQARGQQRPEALPVEADTESRSPEQPQHGAIPAIDDQPVLATAMQSKDYKKA